MAPKNKIEKPKKNNKKKTIKRNSEKTSTHKTVAAPKEKKGKERTEEERQRNREYCRAWHKRNAEYVKKRKREAYAAADRHKMREYRHGHYLKHREAILTNLKQKRQRLREEEVRRWSIVGKVPVPILPDSPRKPPKTSMIELVRDLFPDIIQVFY